MGTQILGQLRVKMGVVILFVDVVVAPPAVYMEYVRSKLNAQIGVAAQNCYKAEKGAFTGDIRYITLPTHTKSLAMFISVN